MGASGVLGRMKVKLLLAKKSSVVAAACLLLFAPTIASGEDGLLGSILNPAPEPAAGQEAARRPVRVRKEEPRKAAHRNRGIENRVPPKRRAGKEGSAEAKLDAEQAKELYLRRKLRLEQIQAQQRELSKDKRTLATNRARMRARLIETARALRLSERRLTEIEDKLAVTRVKVKEQREKLDEKSAQMSTLLVLMQGMTREPPPVLITHTRDALKMIRTGMVLATFYSDIEKLAVQLSTEVGQLEATQKEAELQEQRRKSEQLQHARLKTQIDALLAENREQIDANATTLETLKSVTKVNVSSMKSLEEMLPALDDAAKKRPGGVAELKKGAELAPEGARMAALQPGQMKPSIPFANAQGFLPLPVQGKLLLKFGQSDQDGTPSKGIHLETRPSAQVISPCDGLVLYTGPFRSYGQLLIINPGGGYHVVIAGMERIEAQQGQTVLAGEPIATMGAQTRTGDKTPKRPSLYIEFRKDQQSIDPEPWWPGGKG
jgi:murein hydrolase activator